MRNKVLIAGGLGVVGRAAVEHFSSLPNWDIVALSRRAPDFASRANFLSLDLTDRDACRRVLAPLGDITHLVYAALHEQGSLVRGWTEGDHVRINLAMFENLLDAVEAASPALRHITLMHGGKAYGVHLGPLRHAPSKETEPRTMPPNFYYDQEDLVRARQRGKNWCWTALRPPAVCGFALGSPMNTVAGIGVYAALSRELGLPLVFPGAEGHIKDACDARLLARAIAWAGESPAAANEAFNVANGDCFMWEQVWPRFAALFGMPVGTAHPMPLGRVMADKGAVWQQITRKHGLRPYSLEQLIPSWEYMDFTFRLGQAPFPSLLSTIKLRRAGFPDCIDTEEMFVELLRQLQSEKILPV